MPRVNDNAFTAQEVQLIATTLFSGLENFECLILEATPGQPANEFDEENIYKLFAASLLNVKATPVNILLVIQQPNADFAFIYLTQTNKEAPCVISSITLSNCNQLTQLVLSLVSRLHGRFPRLIEFSVQGMAPIERLIELSVQGKEPIEGKEPIDIGKDILLVIKQLSDKLTPFIQDGTNPDTCLEQGLARKFAAIPSFKAAIKIATKQTIPLWLAMTTFTASSLASLSIYGKSSNDLLLTSAIILTLQRVLWALASTPQQSNLINISRAITREPEIIGRVIQAGWIFAILLGSMNALISGLLVAPLLSSFKISDNLVSIAGDVFSAYAPGLIGYALMDCCIKILIALKNPLPVLVASLMASIIGVLCVYGFSTSGNDRYVKEGYAYGQTIQSWLVAVSLFSYILLSDTRTTYKLFGFYKGVLPELWGNVKEGFPIFFQRNADVFGTFFLALIAAGIGPIALISENIIESYRLSFGRVGINSVSLALTGLMGNQMGCAKLALDNKLNPSPEQRRSIIHNIQLLRNAGFVLTTIHSGVWFLLYAAMPKALASAFVRDEDYLQYPNLETTLRNTFLISGAGQFFDDFRQVYMAEFNAGKHFVITTVAPNLFNFGIMAALAYLLSLEMGTEGLETANGIMFLMVTACVFAPVAKYYSNQLLKALIPDDQQSVKNPENSEAKRYEQKSDGEITPSVEKTGWGRFITFGFIRKPQTTTRAPAVSLAQAASNDVPVEDAVFDFS